MKPITEQERKDLISHGNDLKGRIEHIFHKSDFESKTLRLVEIALTSLTSVPVAYAVSNDFWNTPGKERHVEGKHCDLFFPGARYRGEIVETSEYDHVFELITAPPVPVINLDELLAAIESSDEAQDLSPGQMRTIAKEILSYFNGIK